MNVNGRFAPRAVLALAASVLFWGSPAAKAEQVIERMEFAATNISRFLKEYNERSIAVAFSGPANFKGSGDRALEQYLADALKKKGIRVVPRATFAVKGEFAPKPIDRDDIGLSVSIHIVDRFQKKMLDQDIGFFLDSEKELFRLIGLSGSLHNAKGEQRRKSVRRSFENPGISLISSSARAKRSSPFSVQIRVDDKARRLYSKNGLGFFEMDIDEEYVIRLINNSDHEAAVQVFVDGLSIFHFSEVRAKDNARKGLPRYRYYIVPPRKSVDVRGWHKSAQRALAFRIAPAKESAAAMLGRTSDIGMITAIFHASWKQDQRPPRDEPANPRERITQVLLTQRMEVKDVNGKRITLDIPKMVMKTTHVLGTTFGTDIVTATRGVVRSIGQIRSTVTLRYEKAD